MNSRIRNLRKLLGLSQKNFAESLGLKQNAISYMEKDGFTVTEHNIKSICILYHVNETWLRSGIGEIFSHMEITNPHKEVNDLNIHGRLKYLRGILKLTTRAFGDSINMSCGAITNMENGTRNITERTIRDICREHNVNPDWLRNGTEPIFIVPSEPSDTLTTEKIELFKKIQHMSDTKVKVLIAFVNSLDELNL